MYSYGPPNMAKQKQDDQLEHTYSSYVRIRDVALKTCQRRWMIGRSGERESGISVLAARHDDDDDVYKQVKLETVVDGEPKAPFSLTTEPRCREGYYSFSWIAPLYPWSLPYNAEGQGYPCKRHDMMMMTIYF